MEQRKKNFIALISVLFLLIVFITTNTIAQGIKANLFENANRESNLSNVQVGLLDHIKTRVSTKNVKVLKLIDGDLTKNEQIAIPLFDDNLEMAKEKIDIRKTSDITWYGRDSNNNYAVIVKQNNDITGSIYYNSKKYKIEPLGDGFHAIIEFDEKKLPPEDCEFNEDQLNKKDSHFNKESSLLYKTTTETIEYVDVLVAYTPSAANASGNINGLIQTAISEANASYEASNINIRLNLAYSYQVSYSESGKTYDQIVNAFQSTTDGNMDEVHSYRNTYSADVCVLIINNIDYCGIAYYIQASESQAFCAVHYDCATGYYSFAHEIGHLQGARHNRINDPNGTYNHGFRYKPGAWRTIMAYDTTFSYYTRLNFWSNPDQTYNSVPRGTSNYENNTRQLNETRNNVALFRPFTLSGTLTRNESWRRDISLTGNITVPSGYALRIEASTNLNINGYSITSTGGTITVQGGATINGAVLLTGSTYKGIYPTMQAALSAAVSGQTVTVNIAQNVTTNLSVPTGVALFLNSSATVTFSSAKKISVYGSLNASGTTFQGNGTAGYWNSLSFYSGSSGTIQNSTIRDAVCGIYTNNSNVTISNNTITNNSLYGISSISSSTINVSSCTISNNGTGINANSVAITITGNSILNNTNYGINATSITGNPSWDNNELHGNGYAMVLNNASPWLSHNIICTNSYGVVINSAFPIFHAYGGMGYNAITYSSTPLFKADNASTVDAGSAGGAYNSIFGSDLPDMEARNNSGISANYNYWGWQPNVYADGTSWITTSAPLTSDPNPNSCSPLSASRSGQTASVAVKRNTSSMQGGNAYKYEEAISNGRTGYFKKAKEALLSLVDGEFDHKYSPLALIAFCEVARNEKYIKSKEAEIDTANNWLNNLLTKFSKRAKSDSLRPYALRLLAREAALAHDTRAMITYNKELVDTYPNSSNELSALYDLTIHYSEIEQDYTKANEYYSRMVTAYPKEDLTLFAGINLGGNQASLKQIMLADADQLPIDYDLSNAFPNPFNPITTITYQLPKEGLVTLKIYDILGNEVKTLVNENKEMGKYTVQFDASSLASGMYVYQLRANDYTSTKKMLLLK